MERSPLLPLPEGISIEQIKATETTLTITVVSTQRVLAAAVSRALRACA